MTTLVTGGNGWVPSHIMRALARRGEEVVSYDLMVPDDLLKRFLGDAQERIRFVIGDVTDRKLLTDVCQSLNVTTIIHAAAITPRREREQREPARIVEVNLNGTINALEAARATPEFRRFIYISSGAVWGDVPAGLKLLDEDTPSYATNLYGLTKYASERLTLRYGDLFDMDVVAIRPANVYGPMERTTPGYVGATELREMLRIWARGEEVWVNSLKGPYLDWTYVEDIAEGIARVWAYEGPLPHRVYSLSRGELHSIGDVLAAFAKYLPNFRYREVPDDEANYHVSGSEPGPVPSGVRFHADLGWSPPTTFDEGMRRYLRWIQEYGPQ